MKEIDVACARTSEKTADCSQNQSLKVDEAHKREIFSRRATGFFPPSSSTRQSTLDRFIGISSNSNVSEGLKRNHNSYSNGFCKNSGDNVHRSNENEEQEGDDSEGNISSVKIDPVATKTWIYPGFFLFPCFLVLIVEDKCYFLSFLIFWY